MHLKTVKVGNYEYVRLMESYRENGVAKQKVVFNFGRRETIEGNISFQRLGERLLEIANAPSNKKLNLFSENVSEGILRNYGFIAYRKLWKMFDLTEFFSQNKTARNKIDFNQFSFLMVVQHLLAPCSKLQTFKNSGKYLGLQKDLDLNNLYRTLDYLAENKETIENYLFEKNRSLFNLEIDVVFYDVTTFHFESNKDDELRNFGYSKANKLNEVQVVMGLLVDREGRPIGYELFPGNTFEGKTLEKSLNKLSERFNISKVVIVADRGINNKINLGCIKEKGYDYIVASRLKNAKRTVIDEVLNLEGYAHLENNSTKLRYKILPQINCFKDENGNSVQLKENLLVMHSEKREAKDRADRQRLVDKAKKLLQTPASIKASNKRGGKKFIEQKSEKEEFRLNERAIERDKNFDGYYTIQTSLEEMKPEEILDAYHTLWKIEESFRIMKSTLQIRPIFHWTKKRIEGHFVVSFLAFLLERTLEFRLKQANIESSPEQIRAGLNSLLFTELEVSGQKYLLKLKATDTANKILRNLSIAPPKNLIPLEEAEKFSW